MAIYTASLNRIVSIFRDIADRHRMLNDFGFGNTEDIGADREMLFPYLWVDAPTVTYQNSGNGIKSLLYNFEFYVMDKIDKGDCNYDDTLSDTQLIVQTILAEIGEHKFYRDMSINLSGEPQSQPATFATDDNVNGWSTTLSLKLPFRITTCTSPIDEIPGYGATSSTDLKMRVGKILSTEFVADENGMWYADVVFANPFVNNKYSINIASSDARTWSISNKTNAGFRIQSNSTEEIEYEVLYTAIEFGDQPIDTAESSLRKKSGAIQVIDFTTDGDGMWYADITFTTPFSSANYSIGLNGGDVRTWSVSNKTSSGFRLQTNSSQAVISSVLYSAIEYGETTSNTIMKTGRISGSLFTGPGNRTGDVTFDSPYPNTNYSIGILGEDVRTWTVSNKTANGFTIESNSSDPFSNDVFYTTIEFGEASVTPFIKSGQLSGAFFTGSGTLSGIANFSTPYPDTNYSISIVGEDVRSFTITNKTANGFTIETNSDEVLYGNVYWYSIKFGESL